MSRIGDRIRHHLGVLVDDIGARPPGSPANRRAPDHVRACLTAAGRSVTALPFTTRWWEPGSGWRAVLAGRLSDLEALEPDPDGVLVLTDELAREQVLPSVFPFLSLAEHERIRAGLRRLAPAAIVAVSDHWEPILEDPDLHVPSTTVPTAIGRRLAPGDVLHLAVSGAVHHGTGVNLSTRLGDPERRLVLCAHLDTKATTPGAFDNATSVATLVALTEFGHLDDLPLELVLFNGEDHVDSCGEMAWLAATDLSGITGVVNVDGGGCALGVQTLAGQHRPAVRCAARPRRSRTEEALDTQAIEVRSLVERSGATHAVATHDPHDRHAWAETI